MAHHHNLLFSTCIRYRLLSLPPKVDQFDKWSKCAGEVVSEKAVSTYRTTAAVRKGLSASACPGTFRNWRANVPFPTLHPKDSGPHRSPPRISARPEFP